MSSLIAKRKIRMDSVPYKVYRRATDGLQAIHQEKFKGITTHQIEMGLGILEVLLALRFFFELFAASSLNLIAQLVYFVTFVFTAPFWGLFGKNPSYALSTSELETLAAMLLYPLITWSVILLIKLHKRSQNSAQHQAGRGIQPTSLA